MTDLKRLFNPGSIALVGASDSRGKVGNIIMGYLKRSGAELYLVNPKLDLIDGSRVYHSVNELPAGMDLAVIATGAKASVEAAEECAKHGAGFIIIIAGGFGEINEDGKKLEKKLKKLTETYGSRIIGPNSLGIFYPESALDTVIC